MKHAWKILWLVIELAAGVVCGGELEETRRLAPKYEAAAEVRLWDGTRVDLLSASEAIEVDWAEKWAEAIGQSLYYAELTGKRPAVVLLVKDLQAELRHCLRCQVVCARAGIRLYVEPVEPPPEVDPPPPVLDPDGPLPDETDQPVSASPTGREPRILWSPAWQSRWRDALENSHPWTEWLKFAVDNPESAYFDKELYPAVLYQITGDAQYARQAWGTMAQKTAKTPSSDGLRANFVTWVILYEWLYPGLTEAERRQWSDHLDRCCLQSANVQLADSDRVVAYYFGVATWAALGSETARGVLQSERFVAARERLRAWAELARGGEWIEGTQYNRGTVPTLLQGLACLRDLGVDDPFEEYWEIVPDFAAAGVHRMSGHLAAQWNWGPTQDLWLHRVSRYDFLLPGWAIAAELADSDALRAQILRTAELGAYAAKPRANFFLHADPGFANRAMTPVPKLLVCEGQQLLFARSSWEPDATFVGFRCGRHNQVHHPTFDAGNFEVYRRGEWAITSPWRYDDLGTTDGHGGNNSLLVGNQPLNFTRREMLGAGEVNGAYYLVLETGGPWRNGQGAIEYLHSHTRWLVWLPGESDVIIVRDVLNVSQPTDQRYQPSGAKSKAYNIGAAWQRHADYIESQATDAAIPLVQAVFHARQADSKPAFSINTGTVTWTTAGGQRLDVLPLLPRDRRIDVLDEREVFAGQATWVVAEKERGWQIRLSPAGFTGGTIELLHAITISGAAGQEQPAIAIEDGKLRVGTRLIGFTGSGISW